MPREKYVLFGRLSPFPASPARWTSARAQIPLGDRKAGSATGAGGCPRATHLPPTPGPWRTAPAIAGNPLRAPWCHLLPRNIPSKTALLSACLGLLVTSRVGVVKISGRHAFGCTSGHTREGPVWSASKGEALYPCRRLDRFHFILINRYIH